MSADFEEQATQTSLWTTKRFDPNVVTSYCFDHFLKLCPHIAAPVNHQFMSGNMLGTKLDGLVR